MPEKMNDQMRARIQKMHNLERGGIYPFGHRFKRTHLAQPLHDEYDSLSKEQLEKLNKKVVIGGRMVAKRGSGKVGFADILDRTGKIQIYARRDVVGRDNYKLYKHADLGDNFGFDGIMMKTDTGELTVRVTKIHFLDKALRPLPDKYHGLKNKAQRYRQRYLDLISNRDSFDRFEKRTKILKAVKSYLDNALDCTEVETPILNTAPIGANARPFITHHNAMDIDLYMRIALELPLNRLIVGGLERVYEMGRVFRNEGMDPHHNPEFTELETYIQYYDMDADMDEMEGIFKAAANAVTTDGIVKYQGHTIDMNKPFRRLHMVDAIKDVTGVDFWPKMSLDQAKKLAKEHNVEVKPYYQVGNIINQFFEDKVKTHIKQPTFIYGHPAAISPLAKRDQKDPRFTRRFEFYILGTEYGNAYSELNNPFTQLKAFKKQADEKKHGNAGAESIDTDYVKALEYGLPPTGGIGIGMDRLVMLLTNAESIRDVLLFPTMRPNE